MNKKEPLVCIILVNYNGYQDTKECVESIRHIKYQNYKVIIVDNHSKDQDVLKQDVYLNQNAEIIYAEENGGFSKGNNLGIQECMKYNPDYVLLLNNDTLVMPDFLNQMVETAESDQNIAITTGRIHYASAKDKSWYDGGSYSFWTGFVKDHTLANQNEKKQYQVTFSTGCLLLIPVWYIRKYGMLSERYFLYSEDTDYCCKALQNGFRIVSLKDLLIYHKVNASTETGSHLQQYYLIRNYLICAKEYGKFFPLAYCTRFLQAVYEVVRYHYDWNTILLAFHDYQKGIEGKVDYFG